MSKPKTIDLPPTTESAAAHCESDPSLNNYIKKPKFSRDQFDYDVTRKGYEPRKLVCEELSEHAPKVQTSHWMAKCKDVPKLSTVLTRVIN